MLRHLLRATTRARRVQGVAARAFVNYKPSDIAANAEDYARLKQKEIEQQRTYATQQPPAERKPLNLDELLREPLVQEIIGDATLDPLINELKRDPRFKNSGTLFPLQVAERPPVRVTVTGASGAIGYALVFRIASGAMLGPQQPVILQLLELPEAMNALEGVAMELEDCAFPLLRGIVKTDNAEKAFEGADFGLLVGAKPRGPGMERADLLKDNGKIFSVQGKAINRAAKKTIKVVLVGNPANTNALICAHHAKDIPRENFTALTRLDHNRALGSLAVKAKCDVKDIERMAIWGNHSPTMYPDISHALIKGKWAKQVINDQRWVESKFIPDVQQRGAAIIKARGASSAASAASAAVDHIRDWVLGTNGQWTSMAIPSDGSYGIEEGVICSFPVICEAGQYYKVMNVPVDEFSAQKIEVSRKELFTERDAVADLLK